jgi:hypothetical protein
MHLLHAEGFRAEAENCHMVFAVLQAVAFAVSQQRNHTFNKFVHLTDLIGVLVLWRHFWKQSRKDQSCARHPGTQRNPKQQNTQKLRNHQPKPLELKPTTCTLIKTSC